MKFVVTSETAEFHSPLKNGDWTRERLERRQDPLTGRVAICAESLREKYRMFLNPTDKELLVRLAAETRSGCFFCPEKVRVATPTYGEGLAPEGRIEVGEALLFPNLFPLARIHAVAIFGQDHFLPLYRFTVDAVRDALIACLRLIRRVTKIDPSIHQLSINCNYLYPAGASILHPHVQVMGSTEPSTQLAIQERACREYHQRHGQSYWPALVDEERRRGERYAARIGSSHWIAAFAPQGTNEFYGVLPGVRRVSEVTDEMAEELARGLVGLFRFFDDNGYSSLNFTISGGPENAPGAWSSVALRLVTRQNAAAVYRSDDYYLQKLLGDELILQRPEDLADAARPYLTDDEG